jgi:hypothetical protein
MADLKNKIAITGTVGKEEREVILNENVQLPAEQFPPEVALTVTVDGKSRRITFNEDVALTVAIGDQRRAISFKELTLSNNFAMEALVKLLVDKKIIDVQDLQTTMDSVRKERYQMPGQNPGNK